MKKELKSTRGCLPLLKILLLTATTAILSALPVPKARADFQGQQQGWYAVSNIPLVIPAGSTVVPTNAAIPILAGKPLGFEWNWSGATNVSITFHPSLDGTNSITNISWTITVTNAVTPFTNAAGVAFLTLGTNWPAATLDGYYAVIITAITTTGSIPATNYIQYPTNSLPSPTNAPSTNGMIYNQPFF